ncbi:MAG: hypothetical protein JJT89_14680 [Nitriliruptoraceae bacterium]|nr:hypothetical protein [Nitriliruptoraceae bacterium]
MGRTRALRTRLRQEQGISLVEVMIAALLLATAFLALSQVATSGLFALRSTADRTTASGLATQTVEAARSIPWAELGMDEDEHDVRCPGTFTVDESGGLVEQTMCIVDGGVRDELPYWGTDGEYDIETHVTAIDGFGNARRVTAVVTWQERGATRELRTSTVVAQVQRG